MKYLYIDNDNILKTKNNKIYHYEFAPSESGGTTIDTNRKLIKIKASGMKYSDLPSSMCERCNDNEIELSGVYTLRNRVLINDIYYYIKSSSIYEDKLIFSCMISKDCSEPDYNIANEGEYLIIPEGTTVSDYIDFVNANSEALYLELRTEHEEDEIIEPLVANLVGIDLYNAHDCRITETEAYDKQVPFLLDEPMQIAELIRTLKQEYPKIQLYSDANDRTNKLKNGQALYYEASLFDDVSRLKSVLHYNDPVYGKVQMDEIPINFRYETSDYIQYINTRNNFLLNQFLTPIDRIYPKIDSEERIGIGVSWNRQIDEQHPEKVADISDRLVYSFEVRCTIIGLLLEKNEEPALIEDVLTFLYTRPDQGLYDIENRSIEIVGETEI